MCTCVFQSSERICLFIVSGNETNISPGRRFMIDLLVGSLMADGGLESALNAAITAEIQVCLFLYSVYSNRTRKIGNMY